MWSGSMSATGLIVSTVHVVWLIWTKGSGVRRFVRQTGTLALLSTSDRAITLPAKRWTPPVSGQLIVRLDVCMLLDALVDTTPPSAHGRCLIHNRCWVQIYYREGWQFAQEKGTTVQCVSVWHFVFLKGICIRAMKVNLCVRACVEIFACLCFT